MGVKQGSIQRVQTRGGAYSMQAYQGSRVNVSQMRNGRRTRASGVGGIASGPLGNDRLNVRNMPNRNG